MKIDDIDRKIITILQQDGRIQNVDLARRVGLSPSPCLRRVKALEAASAIEGYTALVNARKVGMDMTVYARVWLTGQDTSTTDHFIDNIMQLPQVVECYLMAGDCDFLLRIVAKNLDEYRNFQVRHLACIRGVQSVKTDIPMQEIKRTTVLPLL